MRKRKQKREKKKNCFFASIPKTSKGQGETLTNSKFFQLLPSSSLLKKTNVRR